MSVLLIAGGLALLFLGGELLVRGAVRLAVGLGISPLVVGLTVVGFGTSMPELVTSVHAALTGAPGIAVGNIVGSNIANILLIVGLAALVCPIAVRSAALTRDGMTMLAVALVFSAIAAFWTLDRVVGVTFLAALLAYVAYVVRTERTLPADHGAVRVKAAALEGADPALRASEGMAGSTFGSIGYCLAGLALLVAGGHMLVTGAVALASQLGIADTVIGLTVVAVGTSLPELVTSMIAALRRQADIAFGNIVGSNIYNILGIGGATALLAPVSVPDQIARFDCPAMLAASIVLVVFAWTGLRIGRREGALLIAGYVLYVFLIWP